MGEPWRELLFAATGQDPKQTRYPVAPAQRAAVTLVRAASREVEDVALVRSFGTLMATLRIVRNTCRPPLADAQATCFWVIFGGAKLQVRPRAGDDSKLDD